MSDQCQHCTARGDMPRCLDTTCGQHESWYALEQAERITELEAKLEKYKKALNSVVSLDYHAASVEDASDHLRDAARICRAALTDAPAKGE
jgi:hypothetical protein